MTPKNTPPEGNNSARHNPFLVVLSILGCLGLLVAQLICATYKLVWLLWATLMKPNSDSFSIGLFDAMDEKIEQTRVFDPSAWSCERALNPSRQTLIPGVLTVSFLVVVLVFGVLT
jgi:hypothetical protein